MAGRLSIPLEAAVDLALCLAEAESTPRRYIGASMVAQECERAVWYDWLWATEKIWPGRMLRRFDTGHTMEARVIDYLQRAGYEVHAENPNARNSKKQYAAETLGGLLRGHVDGFIRGSDSAGLCELGDEWHLLEVKAMRSAKYRYHDDDDSYDEPIGNKLSDNKQKQEGRWWKTKRRGVKDEQQTHFGQLQAYMGISREPGYKGKPHWVNWGLDAPLSRALYLAINTDTEQMHAELVEFDARWWRAIKRRAMRIIRDRGNGPDRIKETPMWPPCSFCDHRDVCHGVQPMAVSCRSCIHAEVKMPGDTGFFGKRAQWMCNKHGHNCGSFEACDNYESLKGEEVSF